MQQRTGILLVNLGTPDSPKPNDVYRYLIEFLTDKRVLDISWLKRQLLVRGIIVPFRYKASAKAYQEIWTEEGSPLLVNSKKLQKALQEDLGDSYVVELGMRYRNPSLEGALDRLLAANITSLVVVPLFPQYASATNGSVIEKVMQLLSGKQVIPQVTFIDNYSTHPGLIEAFSCVGKEHDHEEYDRVLFSFHGLPERQLLAAGCKRSCTVDNSCCKKMSLANRNCYAAQCYATAQGIAEKLNIASDRYTVCFQSRLGKEPWLAPYTAQVIADCAKNNEKKILVFSPSFVGDCLETLYEIGMEYETDFIKAGGKKLTLVSGLNDHPSWVKALKAIITE